MKKRIIAIILSFILLVNCPMTVLATPTGGASVNSGTETISVSDNTIPEESEEEAEETTEDSMVECVETEEESTGEEENVIETEPMTEPESMTEPDNVEEATSEIEADILKNSVDKMVDGIPEQLDAVVKEAKVRLRELTEEKAIYALVYLTDSYNVKGAPSKEADTVAAVPSAKTVQILDVEVEWIYDEEWEEYFPTIWYYVQFYVGETLKDGYVEDAFLAYSDELLIAWQNDYPELFSAMESLLSTNAVYGTSGTYTDVEKFPSSYQVYLRKLKDAHPNWTFVPMNVNMDWDDCVDEQMGTDGTGDPYSWIYYNQPAKFLWTKISDTWYRASRVGVEYYMDPRNFLDDTYVFQFEQNSFNESYHSTDALDKYFKGSFMEGNVPDKLPDEVKQYGRTYSDVFYYVGKSRGISPFFLAAKVMLEQGRSGSSMVSGTYPGYESLYNFFNIGASGTGTTAIVNGLTYARNNGWTTRYKSIAGGAQSYGNGYILKGQDTLYLQKFDVEHGRDSLHQYMQNIKAPSQDGASVKSMYVSSGAINSKFVFKIPVFNNMPTLGYEMSTNSPVKLQKGQTKQLSMKYNGAKITDLSIFTFKSDNPEIANVSSTGKITAVGSGEDYSGRTTIRATLKEDTKIYFDVNVIVTCPLVEISLDVSDNTLYYLTEEMPDSIPYLENGETKYRKKSECPTETTITVIYNPEDTTDDRKVKWTVEDENVVSLEILDANASKVKLTAKEGGATTITAVVGGSKASVPITVRVPITEAALNKNEITLYKGQKERLIVSYFPYNTTDVVEPEWKSTDETVVKIVDGEIVAVKEGVATVQAAIGPFAFDGVSEEDSERLSCTVTVEEHTVTFMNEDDSVLTEVSGVYGEQLANLDIALGKPVVDGNLWSLIKEGHVFVGWYTEKNGEGNPVTQETVLYESMILYPYFVSTDIDFHIKPIGSVTYTGGYIKPSVMVYAGEELLTKGIDYTVSYVNNRDVYNIDSGLELPKAIVKGRGKYAGYGAEETFIIVPKNIADIDVTSPNITVSYNGKIQKIIPFVRDAGRILQRG